MNPVVLDASVGVKLFRNEEGTHHMRELLARHGDGTCTICVPTLFLYEFAGLAQRVLGTSEARALCDLMTTWQFEVYELSSALADEAWNQAETFGCSYYDAVSPALAYMLDAPLYSADRRAHAAISSAILLG